MWSRVVQLVFVLLRVGVLSVVTFSKLCVCFLLCLLFLILFLYIGVHAEGYGAIGVRWGKRAKVAGDVFAGKHIKNVCAFLSRQKNV